MELISYIVTPQMKVDIWGASLGMPPIRKRYEQAEAAAQ